jgi:hypothetical protein
MWVGSEEDQKRNQKKSSQWDCSFKMRVGMVNLRLNSMRDTINDVKRGKDAKRKRNEKKNGKRY